LIVGVLFSINKRDLGLCHGALVGGLAAFSMLSHGGSFFPLSGIAIAYCLKKGVPSLPFCFSVVVFFVVSMIPWSLYQCAVDPPGNRLIKWHLAGVIPVDSRTFMETLFDSYDSLSVRTIVENKISNFVVLFDNFKVWPLQFARIVLGLSSVSEKVLFRQSQFFSVAVSLGAFCLAPICFLYKKRVDNFSCIYIYNIFFVISLFTVLVWCLLLFGPSATVIHQGSLALLVFLYIGCVLLLISRSSFLTFLFVGVHILSVRNIYFSYGWRIQGGDNDFFLLCLSIFSLIMILLFMAKIFLSYK
jgi:hypothetical protein